MDDRLWNVVARKFPAGHCSSAVDAQALAEQLGVELTDIISTIDALAYMEEYRIRRSLLINREQLSGLERAFRKIASDRLRFSSAGDKLLFAELAFLLLDDTTPRPISREIEQLSPKFSQIRGALIELLPGFPNDNRGDLSLLGNDQVDLRPFMVTKALREAGVAKRVASGVLAATCT